MRNYLIIGCGPNWTHDIDRVLRDADEKAENLGEIVIVEPGLYETPTKIRNYIKRKIGRWYNDYQIERFIDGKKVNGEFNLMLASRVFEHFNEDEIGLNLFLLHRVAAPEAKLEIIVPDFVKIVESFNLLEKALNEKSNMKAGEFSLELLKVNTEIFNEPSDPHKSIWSKTFGQYRIEKEGYWKVEQIQYVTLDNRDWYLKFDCRSTKTLTDDI